MLHTFSNNLRLSLALISLFAGLAIAQTTSPATINMAWMYCGHGYPEWYDCYTTDASQSEVRAYLEAELSRRGIHPSDQEWSGNLSDFTVRFPVQGGTEHYRSFDGFIENGVSYDDPCEGIVDPDPFRWAALQFGSLGMSAGGAINSCVGFNHVDEYGQTPLFYAITANNQQTTGWLLGSNVQDPNHRTIAGWTPLMYAARDASVDIIEILLRYGADPTIVAPDGTTAAALALNNPRLNADIRNLLNKQ